MRTHLEYTYTSGTHVLLGQHWRATGEAMPPAGIEVRPAIPWILPLQASRFLLCTQGRGGSLFLNKDNLMRSPEVVMAPVEIIHSLGVPSALFWYWCNREATREEHSGSVYSQLKVFIIVSGTTLRYLGAQVEHAVSRKQGLLKAEIMLSWHLVQH